MDWPAANSRVSVGHVTRIIAALATGSDVIVCHDDKCTLTERQVKSVRLLFSLLRRSRKLVPCPVGLRPVVQDVGWFSLANGTLW